MNIPKFIELNIGTEWVLKVKNNIYVKIQAGRVWNKFLLKKLTSSVIESRKIKVDECVL